MRRKDNSFVVNQGHSMLWGDFVLKCFLLTCAVSGRQANFTFFLVYYYYFSLCFPRPLISKFLNTTAYVLFINIYLVLFILMMYEVESVKKVLCRDPEYKELPS